MKVPRSKDEPGKGGFWRLDPAFCESLDNGEKPYRLRKRRNPPKNKNKNKPPPLGNNNTSPINNIQTPTTQLQHCCDDLACTSSIENQNNQIVAQEMEFHLHISDSSPSGNFNGPNSPSVGSVPPNILQHIQQSHTNPSMQAAYSPPEGITLLQNIQMISDSSPESANMLQSSGNFLELTAAERIFDSNGQCVYVLCTDQNLSSLNINISGSNDNSVGSTSVHHIQLSNVSTISNNSTSETSTSPQYLHGTSSECSTVSGSFPMNIENTIEIPMEGGVGSEISDIKLSDDARKVVSSSPLTSTSPDTATSMVFTTSAGNYRVAGDDHPTFHSQTVNGNIVRQVLLQPLTNVIDGPELGGSMEDGEGGSQLATLTNASAEVIEISTLAANIEKESNQYANSRGAYTTTATAAIVGASGLAHDLGTITWDERCGPSINFLETELDLEELIMSGEL